MMMKPSTLLLCVFVALYCTAIFAYYGRNYHRDDDRYRDDRYDDDRYDDRHDNYYNRNRGRNTNIRQDAQDQIEPQLQEVRSAQIIQNQHQNADSRWDSRDDRNNHHYDSRYVNNRY